jgi:ketosteroid isomerase-like protein
LADAIERVRTGAQAFERGDLQAVLENLDPEVEFTITAGMAGEGRTYRGRAGARAAIRQMIGGLDGYNAHVDRLLEADDGRVVLLAVHGGYDRGLGRQVELSPGVVISARDGRAVQVEIFEEWVEALESAGLDPALTERSPARVASRREHPEGDGEAIWPDGD